MTWRRPSIIRLARYYWQVKGEPNRNIIISRVNGYHGSTIAGAKDVRGVAINHAFIERVTYVVGKDHKIVAVMSSNDDKLTPDQHVDKSLEIVQKLASK